MFSRDSVFHSVDSFKFFELTLVEEERLDLSLL